MGFGIVKAEDPESLLVSVTQPSNPKSIFFTGILIHCNILYFGLFFPVNQ